MLLVRVNIQIGDEMNRILAFIGGIIAIIIVVAGFTWLINMVVLKVKSPLSNDGMTASISEVETVTKEVMLSTFVMCECECKLDEARNEIIKLHNKKAELIDKNMKKHYEIINLMSQNGELMTENKELKNKVFYLKNPKSIPDSIELQQELGK